MADVLSVSVLVLLLPPLLLVAGVEDCRDEQPATQIVMTEASKSVKTLREYDFMGYPLTG